TSNPSGLSDLPNSPAVPGKGSRPASNQNPSMNTDTSNKPDKKAQALPETGDSKADSLMIFLGLMIVTFVGSLNKHQED
ncbi:LPXTG cell wall anchor domain-containing protein, partial [Streptococcus sobrinus]